MPLPAASIAAFVASLGAHDALAVDGAAEAAAAADGADTAPRSRASDCTVCPDLSLTDLAALRAHCHTDWHVHNVRARLRARPPLSRVEFDALPPASDGASSDANSDPASGAESDEEPAEPAGSPCVRFHVDGRPAHVLLAYKCALFGRDELAPRAAVRHLTGAALRAALERAAHVVWIVLLVRSGRVAAAVFDNATATQLAAKTFKRYTTRRKQGGSQMSRDAGGGGPTRSAGAALRRANERHLVEVRSAGASLTAGRAAPAGRVGQQPSRARRSHLLEPDRLGPALSLQQRGAAQRRSAPPPHPLHHLPADRRRGPPLLPAALPHPHQAAGLIARSARANHRTACRPKAPHSPCRRR